MSAKEAIPISITRIAPPGRWPELGLRELWQYRELLYFLVWRDIKVRYKQTFIGAAWAVIQPFFTMVVFTIFFGRLLGIPTGGLPDPVFYYSGLLPWIYFSTALANATNRLVEHQSVITKIYFPRLILPLSAIVPGMVDFAIAFVVLFGMLFVYGLPLGATLLLAPLFLFLAALSALSVGLWLSALNAMYRDVRFALGFLIQVWFFVSPVIYSADVLPEGIRWAYGLNPMVGVIEGFRWAVVGQGQAPTVLTLVSVLMVVIVLIAGLFFFRNKEPLIADVV